ncbi:MAG: glycosyltransferase [Crocinitomicaceae bacterium]
MTNLLHLASGLFLIPVCYTYIIYPIALILISKKKNNNQLFHLKENAPSLTILMAAHNEDRIIKKKIESILASSYSLDKLEIIIGTDCCTDNTDKIISDYTEKHPQIKHHVFDRRQGKVRIINKLVKESKNEILVLTDANVLFSKSTLFELTKHFKNKRIGLVDSHMKNYGMNPSGISLPEQSYISLEVRLKDAEGKLWGTMMGPFGGCFAIRKSLFKAVPENYLVDDFHLSMNVLDQGAHCIHESKAIVYEDVSNHLNAEFNRKIRISTGNFQNLLHFAFMLFKPKKIAFTFISHKVIRWISPFFIIASLIFALFTFSESSISSLLLICYLSLISIVLIDIVLMKLGLHIRLLRYITHFTLMNLALLIGFFGFLRGNSNGIWKRTERLQN